MGGAFWKKPSRWQILVDERNEQSWSGEQSIDQCTVNLYYSTGSGEEEEEEEQEQEQEEEEDGSRTGKAQRIFPTAHDGTTIFTKGGLSSPDEEADFFKSFVSMLVH